MFRFLTYLKHEGIRLMAILSDGNLTKCVFVAQIGSECLSPNRAKENRTRTERMDVSAGIERTRELSYDRKAQEYYE